MASNKLNDQQKKLRSAEKLASSSPSTISSPSSSTPSVLWNKIESRFEAMNKTLNAITDSIVTQLKMEIDTLCTGLSLRIDRIEENVDKKIEKFENAFNERMISFNHSLFTLGSRLDALEEQGNRLDGHEDELSLVKAQLMEKDNTMLKIQIDALARNNISGDLVLHGIPIEANENLKSLFLRFCDLINLSPPPTPITIIRTKPKNNVKSSAIIIKLPHAVDKVNVLSHSNAFYRKKLRAVSLSDLGFVGNKFVRVYESLTKHNHTIFRKANELRKSGLLNSVFTRRGRVYVRQSNDVNKKPLCVTSLDSLEVFCAISPNMDVNNMESNVYTGVAVGRIGVAADVDVAAEVSSVTTTGAVPAADDAFNV